MKHKNQDVHPDRLLSISRKYKNPQNKVRGIIREAIKKDYTILPADFMKDGINKGLVFYKTVEDEMELGYNITWKMNLGIDIGVELPHYPSHLEENGE